MKIMILLLSFFLSVSLFAEMTCYENNFKTDETTEILFSIPYEIHKNGTKCPAAIKTGNIILWAIGEQSKSCRYSSTREYVKENSIFTTTLTVTCKFSD